MSKSKPIKDIAVVGLGYVGLPLALLTALKGYNVVGIDVGKERVAAINAGKDPIGEKYVAKYIANTTMKATTKFSVIKKCQIIIICVPTPVKGGYEPDFTYLTSAVKQVAEKISKGSLVAIESTVNPGVCDEIVIPLLEKKSGLKLNQDFYVSHCPERINPGDPNWSVENIPRVAGSSDRKGLKMTIDFYSSIIDAPIKPMANIKEAEAVKVVENSFRDINIAFVNELAMSFTKLDIDVKNVIDGAATKPFSFMPHYPSVGVGGHCIPVDPYYLIKYAQGYGFEHEFLSLARAINNRMPEFTVDRLIDGLGEVGIVIKGAKIAVLGLSYKANVGDDRESPSYKLISILKEKGARVATYDPYFLEKSTAKSLDEVLKNKDAVVLATSHNEFQALKPKDFKVRVFVDGKNIFNVSDFARTGTIYRGIGR